MNAFVADGPRRLRDAQRPEYDARFLAEMQVLLDAHRAQLETASFLNKIRLRFELWSAEGHVKRALEDECAAEGWSLKGEGSLWSDPDIDRRLFVAHGPASRVVGGSEAGDGER